MRRPPPAIAGDERQAFPCMAEELGGGIERALAQDEAIAGWHAGQRPGRKPQQSLGLLTSTICSDWPCVVDRLSETCSASPSGISSRHRESHSGEGKYRFAGADGALNVDSDLRRRFIMAANTADGALLLVKKLGGIVLILFGLIGIAVGLEYRTLEFSAGLTGAGIVALACGMALLALKIIRRNTS
jgi:hypothetical protein